MIPFQTEITINRPVAEVFGFVAEPQNYPKWMKGVTSAEPLGRSASEVGSKVRVVGKLGPWNLDGPMEITAYDENRKFGISGTVGGSMQFQAVWTFEPTGSATTYISETGTATLLGLW